MDELFIYGTLMPGHCRFAILESLKPLWMVPAHMPGFLFDTGSNYPALVLDDGAMQPGHANAFSEPEVFGRCVAFSDFGRAVQVLDKIEGFSIDSPRESLYRRVQRSATLDSGQSREAWVYVYNQPVTGMRWIESGRWQGA